MINDDQFLAAILVLTRVSIFIAFVPLFAKRQLPNLVKFGLALSLSVFWFGEAGENARSVVFGSAYLSPVGSFLMIAREAIIGIVLASLVNLFLWPAKIAGAYVGQELGLTMAAISDPSSQDSSGITTRVFEVFAILIFLSLNLHHLLIYILHASFGRLQITIEPILLQTEEITNALVSMTEYGLLIAGPLVVLFMFITLVLALLNRAAPTLNLFSVGMSLRAGIGVLVLFLVSPVVFDAVVFYMSRVQMDIEDFLETLL